MVRREAEFYVLMTVKPSLQTPLMDREPSTSKCKWPSHSEPQVPRTLSFVPAAAPTTAPSTNRDLPLHLVGLVALAEAERGGEVACEHVNLLDVGQEGLVDGLLVRCPAGGNLLLL